MCAHLWVEVYKRGMHKYAHECGGQRTTLGVSPQTPSNFV